MAPRTPYDGEVLLAQELDAARERKNELALRLSNADTPEADAIQQAYDEAVMDVRDLEETLARRRGDFRVGTSGPRSYSVHR